MKRLHDLCRLQAAEPPPCRRGLTSQWMQRSLEQTIRQQAVDESTWAGGAFGLTRLESAALLHLSPRTLRQWQYDLTRRGERLQALGRPTLRSSRGERMEVLDFLREQGPTVGVPTLRDCFPDMARAELTDLLRRYRRVWRQRYHQTLHVLHWQVPGSVWAMDFAEAPAPIDGLYPYLLAVRDLASGRQLLWLPLKEATTQNTLLALAPLVAVHGAPLVLKSANGSAFGADALLAFLHQAGVIPLFSPPYTPSYNGAIEAGIGSLKTRTAVQAARHGCPGHWTWDDVEAARLEANATARPRGETGPTPDQLWERRRRIPAEERSLFQATVQQQRQQVRHEESFTTTSPLSEPEQRRLDRIALRRALQQHAYLLFSRRCIPLPFTKKKVANIT